MKELDEKLFEQMESLSNGTDEDGFLFFVENNQDLLKKNPITFIGLHVSFYANQEDAVKALQVVEHYKSAPYISMEVEEFLNELKEKLLHLTEPTKQYNDDDIKKFLFSKNENAIVSALHILSKKNIRSYLPLIKEFLLSNAKYKYKTLALFILIEQKVDEDITFDKDGLEYTINPSSNYLPFDQFDYLDTKAEIEKRNENTEVIENAIEILNTVQIKNFPDTVLDIDEIELMADIFILISKSYLGETVSIQEIADKYEIQADKVEEIISQINEIFNS